MTATALPVTAEHRAELARMANSSLLPHRKVVQARALLLAAGGVANEEIARRVEVDSDTVRRWRSRFLDQGPAGDDRDAGRRLDALDDPVDGGPGRDRQGHGGADLGRP